MKGVYSILGKRQVMPGIISLKCRQWLSLLFVLISAQSFGQMFVNNASTTTGSNNIFPWGSTTDMKVEQIYLPTDFTTTPKKGYISKVYFRYLQTFTNTYSNLKIEIGQSSSSVTGTTFFTPVTTCYGPATTSISASVMTWYGIKLATPFLYDPSKTLVVIISHTGYSGTSVQTDVMTSASAVQHRIYGYNQTDLTGVGSDQSEYDFGMDISPAAYNNAGVTQLVSPYAFCPGTLGIQVRTANLGLNDLTSVNVGWSFDGVAQTSVSWPYKIPVGRDTVITLGTKSFAANVPHIIKAWTYTPNTVKDTTPGDDTLLVKNVTPAVSGTFTINPSGSGSSNFTSFTSAVNFVNNNGVCGPVLFKVSPGTYNEQVSLNNVVGTSSTNTITFDGGDSSKTIISFNGSANPSTFQISGTNYVTVKHLGIYTGATSADMALHITNGAAYNTVTGCVILADTNTTNTVTALAISGSTYSTSDGAHHNIIVNNIIKGGYYTVSCFGAGSTTPSAGNQFIGNKVTKAYYSAIYLYYQTGYTLKNNLFSVKPNSANTQYNFLYYSNAGTIDGNTFIANYAPCYLYYADYYVTGGTTLFINNIMYGAYYSSGGYSLYAYYNGNTKIYHNIFYNTLPNSGYALYLYGQSSNNFDVRDNIIYRQNNAIYGVYSSPASYVATMDYNDFWGATGGNFALMGSTYADLPSLQKGLALTPAIANNNSQFADPGFASTIPGAENFRMCKSCYGLTGIYVGVNTDADGNPRCKLFPNMGAYETNNGKGAPIVNFFVTSNIFPNSPSYVYQTYKAGSPTSSHWYLNGVKVSDSTVLLTNKFVTGSNTLKLVVQTCGGSDSVTKTFNVAAPTAVPVTDFVANKNSVITGDIVSFQDLSSNGPTTWTWTISPDSVISGTTKVASVKYTFGNNKYRNPQMQFNYPGKYQVCLVTSNGVGKGSTVCKKDYITVLPAINIGSTKVVSNASGYLYDDGGPSSAYINNGGTPSTLIAPCADSVYLVFTMFDLNCNVSFMQLYEGTDAKGKRIDPCGGSGLNSGLTGGPSGAACNFPCMPSVTKPDTFKAKKSMFIQMNDGASSANAKGFSAYWWSKPSSSKKPKASFVSSGVNDSVCVNVSVNFTNTTVNSNPLDPISYLWDLDGDMTTFECIGTCATAFWPYFLTGPTNVTLIATNCGGSDTLVKVLNVYNPKTPKTAILADNTNPSLKDVVFFTAPIKQCVEDYKWTITKSAGSGTGSANFVNGTTSIYPNPQVTFTDTGYYDVTLAVDNLNASQKDQLTLKKYIHVRQAYCLPSVATLNQGMGISKVVFNTISNTTTQSQFEYTNFTSNLSLTTTLAQGATYPIAISRNSNFLFEPLNRSVFIDWNQDGSFTGKGEEAAEDSNSFSITWNGKITVPKTAKIGATTMRIAVNRGAYSNKPCGQNEFGEYQDYRIYITPYNIAPVITLKGHQGLTDTIKIEQGNPFVEPGYSASSFLYGNVTKSVVRTSRKLGSPYPADSFNSLLPNTYIFSYNVSDSIGNKAIPQYRVVVVYKDKTAPNLVVDKPDTTVMEVTSAPLSPFPAPKVISADDLVDGPLASSVTNDANKVTSNIVGFYTIKYSVTDLSGNTATVYRYVKIIDTVKPVITLLGSNPATLEVYNSFADPGVKTTDNYDKSSDLNSRLVITSNLDSSKLGTYTITYNLTDKSNNKAITVTRTVNVVDTLKPVISLNGAQFDTIEVFTKYADAGVTVSDNYTRVQDIVISKTGSYYTAFPNGKASILGSYTIVYTATDKSGNKGTVTRTVFVVDRTAPVLVLKGSSNISVCRWSNYKDAGVTVTDNYDKLSDITVDTIGTFITNGRTTIENLVTLIYRAKDKSGNIGFSETRHILVKPTQDWPCAMSAIEPGLSLDKYITVYPNPNSGIFTISANLPSQQKVRISVTNMLGQEIAVVHNGILEQNSFKADLSTQPAGVYMLNIVSDNQTITKRIDIAK